MRDEDPMLEDLAPDAIDRGEFTVLEGVFGRSDTEGSWRLYQTRQLDSYFELREDQILRRQSEGGRSLVWVRRDAVVKLVSLGRSEDLLLDLLGDPFGPPLDHRRELMFPFHLPEHRTAVSRNTNLSRCHYVTGL